MEYRVDKTTTSVVQRPAAVRDLYHRSLLGGGEDLGSEIYARRVTMGTSGKISLGTIRSLGVAAGAKNVAFGPRVRRPLLHER